MKQTDKQLDLPAGLVVLSADGMAQFGWQNPETGAFYAEDYGHCIISAVDAVPWQTDISH